MPCRSASCPLKASADLTVKLSPPAREPSFSPFEVACNVLKDVSRFSDWKRPAVKLPWKKEVFLAYVEEYRKRGIRHITTFAVWVDANYKERFGNLDFITEYGEGLSGR